MKIRISRTILAALLLLSTFNLQLSCLFAQGTAFTYQGQLKDGPGPANGSYDLTFSLFGVSSGGSAVGGPVINLATPVTNGLFTVSLDFGTGQFTGLPRWLEIAVRTNGSSSFTTLSPRQPLTPTPYAIYAASAGVGGGSPWLLNGSNTFYTGGRVGIGTATPSIPLHIAAAEPVMVLQDTGPASTQVGYIGFWNATPTETAWLGFGTPGSSLFTMANQRSGGDIALSPGSSGGNVLLSPVSGNVGIGTATPQAKLDVRGDVRLGSSGQYRATAGEENLRMIRGMVDDDGTILEGAGFSVTRNSAGDYTIVFNTAFADAPTFVATPEFRTGFFTAHTDSLNAGQTRVLLWLLNGEGRADSPFHFIAIGPR